MSDLPFFIQNKYVRTYSIGSLCRLFLCKQSAGPNAPQSVKDAWMETVKEVGVNGLGETKNGRTHITQMYIQQAIANYYGLLALSSTIPIYSALRFLFASCSASNCRCAASSNDILGNSVESAIRATQKALYDFDHPLEPGRNHNPPAYLCRLRRQSNCAGNSEMGW